MLAVGPRGDYLIEEGFDSTVISGKLVTKEGLIRLAKIIKGPISQ